LGLGLVLWLPVMGAGLGQITSRLPVRENDDTNGAIYLHHAFHDAVSEGRLSLRDPDQLLPVGYDRLRADGGNSVEMIVSGLLRLVLPWPSWFSVAHLLWIPLNLLAFLPLGLHLWGRLGPSLAAGAAWATLGPTLGQIEASRLTQVVLFALPLASQPDFNQRNIGVISRAFSLHGITLTTEAFISVIDADGSWSVKDGSTAYHVYHSGDSLQVYAVPA
jgi:hypothetical protein